MLRLPDTQRVLLNRPLNFLFAAQYPYVLKLRWPAAALRPSDRMRTSDLTHRAAFHVEHARAFPIAAEFLGTEALWSF
jgi:hypothetical protein